MKLAVVFLSVLIQAVPLRAATPELINGIAVIVGEAVITYKDVQLALQDDLEIMERRYARQPEVFKEKALELERAKTLLDKGFVSKSTYDSRLAQQRSADAAVAAARAQVQARELDLSFPRITSPIPGRVSDHRVDVGNLVAASGSEATLL
ncbi:MAG: hypothetical protein ACO1QB_11910, partial [Verrucomicrobiales bacterium]